MTIRQLLGSFVATVLVLTIFAGTCFARGVDGASGPSRVASSVEVGR